MAFLQQTSSPDAFLNEMTSLESLLLDEFDFVWLIFPSPFIGFHVLLNKYLDFRFSYSLSRTCTRSEEVRWIPSLKRIPVKFVLLTPEPLLAQATEQIKQSKLVKGLISSETKGPVQVSGLQSVTWTRWP